MNGLQVFQKDAFKVRTVIKDGEPWFIAADVCNALEVGNPSQALTRLEDDEHTLISSDGIAGAKNPTITLVSEAGLYTLVLGSRKPEAKVFKRWVTHEVIPSIRKTGSYGKPQGPELIALALVEAHKFLEAKDKQISEMKPKAEFFDTVAGSKTAVHLGDVAKNLDVPGMGRNNLFAFLRDRGVLMADNMPYQVHVDAQRFRVIQQTFTNPKTLQPEVRYTTLVYSKGVTFILDLLAKEGFRPRGVAS